MTTAEMFKNYLLSNGWELNNAASLMERLHVYQKPIRMNRLQYAELNILVSDEELGFGIEDSLGTMEVRLTNFTHKYIEPTILKEMSDIIAKTEKDLLKNELPFCEIYFQKGDDNYALNMSIRKKLFG